MTLNLRRGGVEARLDVAALGVELAAVEADDHGAGRLAAVQADARIALLLGIVEVAVHAGHAFEAPGHVARPGP
jgi:hypothetical protein